MRLERAEHDLDSMMFTMTGSLCGLNFLARQINSQVIHLITMPLFRSKLDKNRNTAQDYDDHAGRDPKNLYKLL